jgi:hypothetical protein
MSHFRCIHIGLARLQRIFVSGAAPSEEHHGGAGEDAVPAAAVTRAAPGSGVLLTTDGQDYWLLLKEHYV